ncbi:putative FCP1 homology domain-containing protein C1271.03c-like [Senna tora]|uniref:Putative FCP1 homology domain-containing protein C1271.03c-like n=1 Tax=Senna tora TaxID=362788 RepID=A0A834W8E7_9FABA|nr:putative FCP1 homology domain-containing protein C1271.03c-like [Senna tora]
MTANVEEEKIYVLDTLQHDKHYYTTVKEFVNDADIAGKFIIWEIAMNKVIEPWNYDMEMKNHTPHGPPKKLLILDMNGVLRIHMDKERKVLGNKGKPIMFKDLTKVWESFKDYDQSNTVLIDDYAYKSYLNPEHTSIITKSFVGVKDDYLSNKLSSVVVLYITP